MIPQIKNYKRRADKKRGLIFSNLFRFKKAKLKLKLFI
jgi:hypothetical protein